MTELFASLINKTRNITIDIWQKLLKWPAGVSVSYAAIVALLFYRNNIFDVPPGQVVLPLIMFTVVVYASYLAFKYLLRDRKSTEIATLVFTVFTVHFDKLFRLFRSLQQEISAPIKDVVLGSLFLLAGFVLCLTLGVVIKRNDNFNEPILKFARATIFSFLALTLTTIAYFYVVNWKLFAYDIPPASVQSKERSAAKDKLPDIYYLVFDRYAGQETLKKYYDFDNQYFIDDMEKEGFIFNKIEYSNYGHTGPSVSSTLNMQYLDKLTASLPPKYSEMMYSRMIDQASLVRILKENSYEVGWSGSWWEPTRNNVTADITYNKIFKARFLGLEFTMTEWQELLLSKHILGRILAADLPLARTVIHYKQPHRRDIVHYQLDALKDYVDRETENPKFAFWHLLVPHTPYVFDENGEVPKYNANPEVQDRHEKEKYTQQLIYINKRIKETVRYILENSPEPPIIIFQPDEGPYLYKDSDGKQVKVSQAERLKWKHNVTSMLYLPGYDQDKIELSPVNIFRFILNEYMGYKFEYLENQNYDYSKSDPYNFKDITGLIEEKSN